MSSIEPFDKRQMPIWHYRGKFPHREYKPLQFITYRLYDSVPKIVIDAWKEELKVTEMTLPNDPKAQELRKRIVYGKEVKLDNLIKKDGLSYTIIQDIDTKKLGRQDVLIEVKEGWTLSTIMHGWRSYTAHQANKILGRTGDFWMDEYFDRYIRDEKHLDTVINYIDNNPVKAGLIEEGQFWPWSSLGLQSARLQEDSTTSKPILGSNDGQ